MTYQLFADEIISADLKAVAAHWNNARAEKRMPAWSDLRPEAIAKQLPIVWSYRYDPEQDEFIGRLGGETITRIFGKNIKGEKLSTLEPIIKRDRLIERIKRVMREPALFRCYEPIFQQGDQFGLGERILMPLGDDGHTGDGILGATAYRLQGYVPSDASRIVQQEIWVSLASS